MSKYFNLLLVACLLSLLTSGSALTLHCIFSMRDVSTLSNVYTCDGTITSAGGDAEHIEYMQTVGHLPNMNNTHVRAVVLQGQNLQVFPKNFIYFFENMDVLQMSNLLISQITPEDMKEHTNIRHLVLSGNYISTITYDVFQNNPLLEEIDLSGNQLHHIAHYIFSRLTSLRMLRLNAAGCIDREGPITESFNFALVVQCPPTASMIGDEIIASSVFDNSVGGIVDNVAGPQFEEHSGELVSLQTRIDNLEAENLRLSEAVEELMDEVFPRVNKR